MLSRQFQLLFVLCGLLCASVVSNANTDLKPYEYESIQCQALSQKIARSLLRVRGNVQPDLLQIPEIIRGYRELYRSQISGSDYLEISFAMAHWRQVTSDYLVKSSIYFEKQFKPELFGELNIRLNEERARDLRSTIESHRGRSTDEIFETFLAQGLYDDLPFHLQRSLDPEQKAQLGPLVSLNLSSKDFKRSNFDEWSQIEELGNYWFTGNHTVNYFGIEFHSGDIFLTNPNAKASGVFASLLSEGQAFTHFAIFVIAKKAGRRIPAVVEMYDKGIKLTPLSEFLASRYLLSAEIYRHRGLSDEVREEIPVLIEKMRKEKRVYDLSFGEGNPQKTHCTNVGLEFFNELGLSLPNTRAELGEGQLTENLKLLGLETTRIISADDYRRSPHFKYVDSIDNGFFTQLAHSRLMAAEFSRLMKTRPLDLHRLPWTFRRDRWGMRQVRKKSKIGKLIMWMHGYDQETLPEGADLLMAMYPTLENTVDKATKRLAKNEFCVRQLIGVLGRPFSFHDMLSDPSILHVVQKRSRGMQGWFAN